MDMTSKTIPSARPKALNVNVNRKKMSANNKNIHTTIEISLRIDLINDSNIIFKPYIRHFLCFYKMIHTDR